MKQSARLMLMLVLLAGCMPSADFKVSLRVVDEDTGQPIPDALVLAGAYLTVNPAMEPPYNRPVAAARGMTDAGGILRLGRVEGMYVGEKPQDKFYKMLESREPKVKCKVTGIEGGSILVFAPGYGVTEQPFQVEGASKEGRSYSWLGDPQDPWYKSPLTLKSMEIRQGTRLTLRISKPKDFDQAYKAFDFDTVIRTLNLTNRDTGTTQKEKDMVWDFFEKQIRYAVWTSTNPYYERQLWKFKDPQTKTEFDHLAFSGTDPDSALQLWMTQKALELLPPEQGEVKEYAHSILAGVKAEGEGTRSRNHYYDLGQVSPEGQLALQWGAIDYPDNPNNEWDWEDAQRYYREGNRAKAYEALGHVLRLLTNLAIPKYTQMQQGAESDFEKTITALLKDNGNNLPSEYYMNGQNIKPAKNAPDIFAAVVGQSVKSSSEGLYAQVNNGTVVNGEAERILGDGAKAAFPRAIAQAAGLMRNYYQLLHRPQFAGPPKGGDGNGGDNPENEVKESTETVVSPKQLKTREEFQKAYELLKALQAEAAKGKSIAELKPHMRRLSEPLKRCIGPEVCEIAVDLLAEEYADLPNEFSPQSDVAGIVRLSRISLLMDVVAKNKNAHALPVLRKYANKRGLAEEMAARAISEIGQAEDMESFIDAMKHSRRAKVDFSGFGPAGVERLMKEIDDPSTSDQTRNEFIARIGQATGPHMIAEYKALLNHSNPKVIEAASHALSRSVTSTDESTMREMLRHSNPTVRYSGLVALDEKLWSMTNVLEVVRLLKTDSSEEVRALAATILGKHKAREAEPALKEALRDRSSWVRQAAEGAIKATNGETDRQIEQYINQIRSRGRK